MKLKHSDAGTVIEVSGDLADRYLAKGWVRLVAEKEIASSPPARKGRPPKTSK